MSKLPDFNELTKKLDLDGLVSSVKSMINPEESALQPKEGDKVGELIAECSELTQEMAQQHAELAKNLKTLHSKLNKLFKELNPPEVAKAEGKSEAEAPSEEKKED